MNYKCTYSDTATYIGNGQYQNPVTGETTTGAEYALRYNCASQGGGCTSEVFSGDYFNDVDPGTEYLEEVTINVQDPKSYQRALNKIMADIESRGWHQRMVAEAQGGGEFLKTADDIAKGSGYFSGLIGAVQISMVSYRKSLSLHDKINSSARFYSTYRGLGTASKILGRVSNTVVVPLTLTLDYNAMQSNQISPRRFAFRTTGLVSSVWGGAVIGSEYGGSWGAAGGALISLSFLGGEIAYDGLNWLWNETAKQIYNFEEGVKNGWYPGR